MQHQPEATPIRGNTNSGNEWQHRPMATPTTGKEPPSPTLNDNVGFVALGGLAVGDHAGDDVNQ